MVLLILWGCAGGPWPRTSEFPVSALDVPPLPDRGATPSSGDPGGFRFAVFGDQRALADGEWQDLLVRIRETAEADPGLLFMIDTGDIVDDGGHSDQFLFLEEILGITDGLPYWVAVGNHEVGNNQDPRARRNAAEFLSHLDDRFSLDRMYYKKEVGPVRFLFLDTNDLVYGPGGSGKTEPVSGSRMERQMEWLMEQLGNDDRGPGNYTVVSMHHPFVQTSAKHREQAIALWSYEFRGRRLPDILADGGVDLILTGHTHTYEQFRLSRTDGAELVLANFSGRPRNAFLWVGAGSRRAVDIRDRDTGWFEEKGWEHLAGWTIVQEQVMLREDEADQFGLVSVSPDGMRLEARFLDSASPGGLRPGAPVRIR